jgi:hypothetical protein
LCQALPKARWSKARCGHLRSRLGKPTGAREVSVKRRTAPFARRGRKTQFFDFVDGAARLDAPAAG